MNVSFSNHLLRTYGLLLSLVAIMGFFQWQTDGVLMQPLNLTNLILQNSYIVVMALGMLLVIVTGHIDLSVGSVCGFIGGLAAVLIVEYDASVTTAVVACLGAGAVIGALQGWFVAYARIPSFIVTLAGMLIFKGLALALLKGQSVGPFPEAFQSISTGFLPDPLEGDEVRWLSWLLGCALVAVTVSVLLWQRAKAQAHHMPTEALGLFITRLGVLAAMALSVCWLLASYKGLPNVLLLMGGLMLLYQFVTTHTVVGRRIYALGGNEKAARLSGVNTEGLTLLTFTNMGVLSAVAGLIFAARLNTATPKAGLGFELDVIAACFIGGASASGGVGKVLGAVIGAFIMGVMNNGMSILGIGIDYQQVIKGAVLLGAVCLDVHNRNRL
jgi:putative multiple sugar transport system permease protein